jgi:ribosomal protein S4
LRLLRRGHLERIKRRRKEKDRRDEERMEKKDAPFQPKWKDVQSKSIEEIKKNLPDVDDETKEWIIREVLLTLRCHYCERARTDACNFAICVRGLMSGVEKE